MQPEEVAMKTWTQSKVDRWLDKRIPPSNAYQFDVNNTFILPTKFGWTMLGLMSCLFILGTNYQNNVILMFCYFIFALLLLSMFHSYVSFVQFHISFHPIDNTFANQLVQVKLDLKSKENRSNLHALSTIAIYNKEHSVYQYLEDGSNIVDIGSYERGIHSVGRLSVESIFPFGMFRCWTHLSVPSQFFVYPAPKRCGLQLRQQQSQGHSGNKTGTPVTTDDLQGIRDYRDSDPIHHVSWKHFAKGQGLLTKDFSERAAISGWLHFDDYIKDSPTKIIIEEALCELSYQVLELTKQDANFGFSIGKHQIMPNTGLKHQQQCLELLALYSAKTQFTGDKSQSQRKL